MYDFSNNVLTELTSVLTKYALNPLFFFLFCSTRKLRGALNFDDVDVGLVSDSLVANSLYLQNGNNSAVTPVKAEEPDF